MLKDIRAYVKGDIYQVLPVDVENYMMKYVNEDIILNSASFSAVTEEDKVVACAGLVLYWNGLYEAWFAIDESIKNEFVSIFRILRTLKNYLKSKNLKNNRVQAIVNSRLYNHESFMRFLEFETEAILKWYFPNRADGIVYRRML